jgi:ABC-type multidrug transport system ATPase subunit
MEMSSLPAVIEISTKFDDPALSWGVVWSWENRVWFSIAMMVGIGSFEWLYLFRLTTSKPPTTKLRVDDPDDAFVPLKTSTNPELEEERKKSVENDAGINAREIVKVFLVPPPDRKSKARKKDNHILKRAVKGISFGIRKNEIFAIVGPTGAGKSVTMGLLAGEYTPEHGSVVLEGKISNSNTKDIGRLYKGCDVSYCPQFDALFPRMTVTQHLEFYARIRGLVWEEESVQEHVRSITQLLGLEKHKDKAPTELSGGYKRRLSLAVSIIGYPKVMMLDEPSTGMDPGARHLVWDVLKPDKAGQDYDLPAILLSSHYMDECERLGSTIAMM